MAMIPTMAANFVSSVGDHLRDSWISCHRIAEHKERRLGTSDVQHVNDHRGPLRIRPVVESKGYSSVCSAATPDDNGRVDRIVLHQRADPRSWLRVTLPVFLNCYGAGRTNGSTSECISSKPECFTPGNLTLTTC